MNHILGIFACGFLLSGCYGYGVVEKVDEAGTPTGDQYEVYLSGGGTLLTVFIGESVLCRGDYKNVTKGAQRALMNCTTQPLNPDTGEIQVVNFLMTGHAVATEEGGDVHEVSFETLSYEANGYQAAEYLSGYVVMADEGADDKLKGIWEKGGFPELRDEFTRLYNGYPKGPLPQ